MITMVQLNNYSWGHELLDLLMNQGKTQNQTNKQNTKPNKQPPYL